MSETESQVGISRARLPTHPNVSHPTTTGLQDHVEQVLKPALELYRARPLKEEILKAGREKDQVACKNRLIRLTPNFSVENMNSRRTKINALQVLEDHRW